MKPDIIEWAQVKHKYNVSIGNAQQKVLLREHIACARYQDHVTDGPGGVYREGGEQREMPLDK